MYQNLKEIADDVKARENLMTLSMGILTRAYGAGRGGSTVRSNIARELASLGVGHLPVELPNWGNEQVRLYIRGTAIADLITAVENLGENHDATLRRLASASSEDTLKKIRELVCD